MALFSYEVVDGQGNIFQGQMEADSPEAVVTRLKGMGYLVLDIKEGIKRSFSLSSLKRKPKVALGDLSLFSRQLAAMLVAGIPLTRCLFALSEQVTSPPLKEAVGKIAANVEAGMSFGEALGGAPTYFFQTVHRNGSSRGSRRYPGRNLGSPVGAIAKR
jgi:type IV pilus assembly protein PilC